MLENNANASETHSKWIVLEVDQRNKHIYEDTDLKINNVSFNHVGFDSVNGKALYQKKFQKVVTVRIGYNEQLRTGNFCSL
jgi:hypothetical protein